MYGEEAPPVSGALLVDPLELRGVRQAHTLATGHPSDCQAFPTPAATGRYYPPPSDGAHTLAEAMGLGSLTSVRLISALHEAPLQVFQDVRVIRPSISEAPTAIQPPSPSLQSLLKHVRNRKRLEKCCKTVFISRSARDGAPYSFPRNAGVRISSGVSGAAFHRFIHSLWINLWINF